MHVGLCDEVRLARTHDSAQGEGTLVDPLLEEVLMDVVHVLAGDNGLVVFAPFSRVYGFPFPLYEADSKALHNPRKDTLGHMGVVVHHWRIGNAAINRAESDQPRHVFGLHGQ